MQNAYSTTKTMFAQPSLRPEIDIHSLDYDFPKTPIRPVVRTGEDAIKNRVMPDKPAVTREASSVQSTTTALSYKAPLPPTAAHDRQQRAIASEATAALSTKRTSRYTAQTFVKAARSGCLDSVLRHIAAGLDVNVGPKLYVGTPLLHAAANGHEAIVRQLLKSGAYVNQARTGGVTALMWAAHNGHTAIVRALLDEGATVDNAETDGVTALIFATQNGHTDTVQALLDRGATVDQALTNGSTALIYAAQDGYTAIVRALLEKGATVDKAKTDGVNALMLAAMSGHTAAVQLLLNAGTNSSLKTFYGKTALNLAIDEHHEEVIELLRARETHPSPQDKGFIRHWFG